MDTPESIKEWLREQGAKGGKARAKALTANQRSAIARKAGKAPKKPRTPKG